VSEKNPVFYNIRRFSKTLKQYIEKYYDSCKNEDETHENMKAEIHTRFEWKEKQRSKTLNS
jgi:hypothetical protein